LVAAEDKPVAAGGCSSRRDRREAVEQASEGHLRFEASQALGGEDEACAVLRQLGQDSLVVGAGHGMELVDDQRGRASLGVRERSLLTDQDLYLFNEGSHYRMYEKLGAHLVGTEGVRGASFGVWAPAASEVSVIGDFNGWDNQANRLTPRGSSGIWEGFIAGLEKGALYKFHIHSHQQQPRHGRNPTKPSERERRKRRPQQETTNEGNR